MKYIYYLTIAIFALLIGTSNVEADELGSNLGLAGNYDTDGYAYGVAISGNYAYVADANNGLVIINIEDPANPTFAGSYDTVNARGVTISGNYAYVADGWGGLVIVNIEDPTNPTFAGSYVTDGNTRGVTISGNYAYLANNNNGLSIFKKTSLLEEIIIINSSSICFGYLYWRYSSLTIKYKIPEAKHKLKTQIARLKEKGIETEEFEEIIKTLEK